MHVLGARGLEREAEGPRVLGKAENAETAQGTLPCLDLLVLCTRLGRGGAVRARFRRFRRKLGIRVRVIRFQVIGEANSWLKGTRTQKKEENVSALGSIHSPKCEG